MYTLNKDRHSILQLLSTRWQLPLAASDAFNEVTMFLSCVTDQIRYNQCTDIFFSILPKFFFEKNHSMNTWRM